MKHYLVFLCFFFMASALADTPPPGTVKAKIEDSSGNALSSTSGSLNVNVTSGGGGGTVNQGAAGLSSWLAQITASALPTNACQETGGHLASIDAKISNPMPVTGTFWQTTQPVSGTLTCNAGSGTFATTASQSGAWSVGVNNFPSTQAVTGTFWQATQPVSAASLPLPVGAATSTLQSSGNSSLAAISAQLPTTLGAKTTANSLPVNIASDQTVPVSGSVSISGSPSVSVSNFPSSQAVTGTFWQATQPVSGSVGITGTPNVAVTSSTLPTGAATSAGLTTINSTLGSPFQAGGSIGNSSFGISGTLPAFASTPTFNLGTLNGAATAANQTSGNEKSQIVDGSGNVISSNSYGGQNFLEVDQSSAGTPGVAISSTNSAQADLIAGTDGTNLRAVSTDTSGNINVNVLSAVNPNDSVLGTGTVTTLDLASTTITVADNQTWITGTPTSGSSATFSVSSAETGMLILSGSWTGQVEVETSQDAGNTYIPHNIHLIGQSVFANTFTQNVAGSINLAAKDHIRVRAIGTMTGTLTARLTTSSNPSSIYVENAIKLIDSSTSVNPASATIKPASTASVASDTSLVVSVSPNNTPVLPNGAATSSNQSTEISDLASIATNTTGLATSANQTTGNSSLSTIATNSANIGSASTMTEDFSAVVASGISSPVLTLLQTGSGMTVSQSSGNLVIASGTTANSETIIRSNSGFTGSLIIKEDSILSQRIANNNFYVEMVDYPAGTTAASYTINSATSVTVTFTTNPFTSANVGQFMYLGGITGAAGIPMRAAIASVSGSTVTYTVAGWPASGTGTLLVFGWNYYHLLYTGTTATNANVGTQREGWQNADVVATINTTASPGHLATMQSEDNTFAVWDQLVSSGTTSAPTIRSQLYQNIPPYSTSLYLQVHALNGTTAPASTTTWTIASVQVDQITSNPVTIGNIKQQSLQGQLPVQIVAGTLPTVTTVAGVTTVSTVTTVGSITSANLAVPGLIADVVSAAITTTATAGPFTPTAGVGYKIDIPVTASTGTTPTYSVAVQESADSGTNWTTVYTFPTITTTGSYTSPPLFFKGNRVQYVQTLTGTTPSFTRAINRLQMSAVAAAPVNNNATFATGTTSTSCSTLAAPANAVGFMLENLSTNTVNMWWAVGATATSTTGMLLEPGRDTGEVHVGQNISLCAASGTPTYSIQWVQQ